MTTEAPGRPARLARAVLVPRATYQAAVLRIGLAAVIAAFLLREWPHRRVLYGDRSPLSYDLALTLIQEEGTFSVLGWWGGRLWFEIVYTVTVLAALAVMAGWRTRATAVLLMVGLVSLENRNPLVGDGGDNILRIMVIYLVLIRCAQVWSLDARRARRARRSAGDGAGSRDPVGVALWAVLGALLFWAFGFPPPVGWPLALWLLWAVQGLWYVVHRASGARELRSVLDGCAAMAHNAGMVVIGAQVCLIYATAGWYKIQGTRWQEGSALYYALHLDYFAPWPWLSAALAGNALLVLALTYLTVAVQVAFPFALANRRLKNALLAVMIAEHAGIAVLLGIPFLSLVMIVCDLVFLPTSFLTRLGAWCARLTRRGRSAPVAPSGRSGPSVSAGSGEAGRPPAATAEPTPVG
ncbi:HTTM domain-containing protein [Streptomyces fradiae]|uniref:HTTM domain-containing protein n=1 Tax=Streptomyces fradiae TaxID=1906 RepID=UPI0033F16389